MKIITASKKKANYYRHISFGLTIFTLVSALIFVLALVKKSNTQLPQRSVQFDYKRCVRLHDVSKVYEIVSQDNNKNILWFATAEGIRVLDTQRFEWIRYGLDHGLPSETISSICFADGVAWVGTWNGIAWFDTLNRIFHTIDDPAVIGAHVLSITSHPDAGIFFSADSRGVFALKNSSVTPRQLSVPFLKPTSRITCVKSIGPFVYMGGENRTLIRYCPQSEKFSKVAFSRKGSEKTYIWDLSMYKGRLICATSDDGIWLEDEGGDTLREWKNFPAKGAYVFADEFDGFWCGTPFGLWRYHDNTDVWIQLVHPQQKDPTDFEVFALANSGDRLWYGSMQLGAGYLRKDRIVWHDLRAGLSNPAVCALASNDTVLWVGYGYQGGGADKFICSGVQYERNFGYNDGLKDPNIQLLEFINNTLYFGGYKGFGYWDVKGRRFIQFDLGNILPHEDIAAIEVDETGGLYLGSVFGIVKYNPFRRSFNFVQSTKGSRVSCFYREGDSLWFGTLVHGVRLYNIGKDSLESVVLLEGKGRIMGITSIFDYVSPSAGAKLFVATREKGCYLIDKKTFIETKLEIPKHLLKEPVESFSNQITTMRCIGSRIWLGTHGVGCLVYNYKEGLWKSFTYYDGLVSDDVRAISDSPLYIWIGCYGGLNRIDKIYLDSLYKFK